MAWVGLWTGSSQCHDLSLHIDLVVRQWLELGCEREVLSATISFCAWRRAESSSRVLPCVAGSRDRTGAQGSDVGNVDIEWNRGQEHAGSENSMRQVARSSEAAHRVFVLLDQWTGSGVSERRVLGVGREEQLSLGVSQLQSLLLQVLWHVIFLSTHTVCLWSFTLCTYK